MEGGESKRKRNPETEGDQLELQKRLRSETSVDMTLPPELFQHAIALSSNNPKVLGVAASVCRGWFGMVLQARKEFIRTRYERQVAKISESQRNQQFGKELFMDRVNNVFTPSEIGRIYKGMIEHPEGESHWGMSIAVRCDSEKFMHKETPTKEELLEGEKGIPLGSSKRGGIPHLPPNFEWPLNYVFAAQFKCRDVALVDFRCLFPTTGILYYFFEYYEYGNEVKVLYYDGPTEVLTPRVPPWYKDDDEVEDGYAKIAKCWLAKFDPAPPKESPPRDKSDENNYEDFVIFPEEDSQKDGVIGEFFDQEWKLEEEDYVRMYGEFGEDFTGVCMFAFIYAPWDDLKKGNYDRLVVLADPSG